MFEEGEKFWGKSQNPSDGVCEHYYVLPFQAQENDKSIRLIPIQSTLDQKRFLLLRGKTSP